MKNLDIYIMEKLKIDKDIKIENPYKDTPLDIALSHIMGEIYRENVIITAYDVSKPSKNEIIIEINKKASSLYPEIREKIDELEDFYNIIGIDTDNTGDNFKIMIEYEESE